MHPPTRIRRISLRSMSDESLYACIYGVKNQLDSASQSRGDFRRLLFRLEHEALRRKEAGI